ncbi:hypothetical protein [Sediminibacterium sp.]|uniref:hypothetical protein n=1 Tax=Sediminibacterium sp. TaxID=1917865 RepID=UPI00272F16EC|nr:hypothetical protein [Sediminibacterium sp.]MDP2421443.1 hypothetical protein [Sediminibacterium sp.]
MKKILFILISAFMVMSCRKGEIPQTDPTFNVLRQNLTAVDFARIDPSTVTTFSSRKSNQRLIRADFQGKERFHDFVVLQLDPDGKVKDGKIIHIEGKPQPLSSNKNKQAFNGSIETSSLKHTDVKRSAIKDGFIMDLHYSQVQTNGVRLNYECADCTLPEVIVSSSYSNGGYNWLSWLSIWSLFNDWPRMEYLLTDYSGGGGGGGGGGYTPPPVISADEENAENKEKIDPKKYMDCFGNVPDAGATCTISIYADIPVDGHPEILFDWSQGNPGHVFIEMYKLGQNGGLVTQTIGFYPSTGFKVLGGGDVNSKVVDNASHEYNARYTIPISPGQLQAAIGQVNAYSGNSYNMTTFNCVDFALGIFNAATGGGISITKQNIPGYPTPGGSNTPQGVYNAINDLGGWGTPGASTVGSKAYGGTSKGPCN